MSFSGIWSHADEFEPILTLSDEFKTDKVQTLMKQFILSDEDVATLKRLFDKEIDEGLRNDERSTPADISRMKMGVTYFTEFFDGTEKGEYIIINLTAQNLILAFAKIKPGFPVKTIKKFLTIDENIRRSPYMKIFEYLCDCLKIFFTENNLLEKTQILGFCSDLPMIQFGIDKAIMNYFTTAGSEFPLNSYDIQKCFEIVLLQECYKDIRIVLRAVMTNNMCLFIYSSYVYGPIDVFLNFENDCDLIYKEEIRMVPKWKPISSQTKHVFIDSELGNFGKSGSMNFIATSMDWSVILEPLSLTRADKECRLESFLSEICILELIRHILIVLHHELVYCRNGDTGKLYEINGISLNDVLNFISSEDLNHSSQLLPGGTIGVSHEDALIAKYVCKIVFIRAALLISICLSRIFLKYEKDELIIAVKCPLLEKYSNFELYIRKFMGVLAPLKKFQIFIVKDDVFMEGAALGTSIINRQQ